MRNFYETTGTFGLKGIMEMKNMDSYIHWRSTQNEALICLQLARFCFKHSFVSATRTFIQNDGLPAMPFQLMYIDQNGGVACYQNINFFLSQLLV